jgi:GNAT superfamily N-acetyltransferase
MTMDPDAPESTPPVSWESDVELRDGTPLHIRPITPGDAAELRHFHAQLSPESVYFRFFAPYPELRDSDVSLFTHCDQVSRVALIALVGPDIVGIGRYDRLRDPAVAEVAFLVRDDFQGHGVGTLLLDRLAHAARDRGVHRFVALVLAGNVRMRRLFVDSGYAMTATFSDGYITMEFSIDPAQPSSSTSSTGSRGVAGIGSP